MSAAIPFFDELPPRAVKASCRLWDAIMSPGYNGVTAYSDFSLDLTREGIAPPTRGIVRRWKAAVELGFVKRPAPADEVAPLPVHKLHVSAVSSEGATDASTQEEAEDACAVYSPTPKGKVERKRRETMRSSVADVPGASSATGEAVQPVIDDGSGEDTGMEGVLDDLGVLPMPEPGAPISAQPMEAAFKGAQFAPVIDNAEALLDALAAELNAAPMPGQPARVITDNGAAFVAMKTAAGRLLEENIIQLSREIEHTARETTARMLRELADQLEHSSL